MLLYRCEVDAAVRHIEPENLRSVAFGLIIGVGSADL